MTTESGSLLLGDRLAPITSEIGFLEGPLEPAVQKFVEWQRPIQKKRGLTLRMRPVSGGLETALESLLPLTSVEARRFLFAPTKSGWVAFFDNSAHGADASSAMSVMSRLLGCQSLRLSAVPETKVGKGRAAKGRYGALIFELFSPGTTDARNLRRSVVLANDGGEWVFEAFGEALPFESTSRYTLPDLRQRFTFENLQGLCRSLSLEPFDASFYLPAGREAKLVEKVGPMAEGERERTLSEARASF